MPVEQAVLDFHPVEEYGEPGQQRMLRGLLVAAVRDMVLSNVNAVQRAGLRVASVDLTSFAVLRSLGIDRCGRRRHRGAGRHRLAGHQHRGPPGRCAAVRAHPADGRPGRHRRRGRHPGHDPPAGRGAQAGAGAERHRPRAAARAPAARWRAPPPTFVDEVRSSLDYYASSAPAGGGCKRLVLSGGGSRLQRPGRAARGRHAAAGHGRQPPEQRQIGRTGLSDEQIDFVQPLVAVPVGLALGADR